MNSFIAYYTKEERGYSAYVTLEGVHYWIHTEGGEQQMRDYIVHIINQYTNLNPSQYSLEYLREENDYYNDDDEITSFIQRMFER
jgi:hypothetical protein